MGDTVRRAAAVSLLTAASLFFASRFHRTIPEPVLTAEPIEPASTSSTIGPAAGTTAPATSTTTTSTTLPATTITLPDDLDGAEYYEGTRVYTNWDWVKVEIAVLDGAMVDVELVMVPRATKRSEALSLEHEPALREEALTTQSPDVQLITGATVISYGYRASLYGAMKAAGLWPPPAG